MTSLSSCQTCWRAHTYTLPGAYLMQRLTCRLATAGVFADTFRILQRRGVVPGVLYPAVSIPWPEDLAANRRSSAKLPSALIGFLGTSRCFLSINRFERKKVSPPTVIHLRSPVILHHSCSRCPVASVKHHDSTCECMQHAPHAPRHWRLRTPTEHRAGRAGAAPSEPRAACGVRLQADRGGRLRRAAAGGARLHEGAGAARPRAGPHPAGPLCIILLLLAG